MLSFKVDAFMYLGLDSCGRGIGTCGTRSDGK